MDSTELLNEIRSKFFNYELGLENGTYIVTVVTVNAEKSFKIIVS